MLTLIEQLVPSLLGNLDASALVRQVNELEDSLLQQNCGVCLFINIAMLGVPQRAKTNKLKKIINTLPQLVNLLLPSRASVEDIVLTVCPTHMLDHPYSFRRVVSRGDPQEVMNLGLAALDSPLEIVSRLSPSTRNLFSLPLA